MFASFLCRNRVLKDLQSAEKNFNEMLEVEKVTLQHLLNQFGFHFLYCNISCRDFACLDYHETLEELLVFNVHSKASCL